jgi:hypothetical protein
MTESSQPPARAGWKEYAAAGLHPLLFASYPFVSVYAQNAREVHLKVFAPPLVLAWVCVLTIEAALFAVARRPAKVGFALSAAVLSFFFFGRIFAGYEAELGAETRLLAWGGTTVVLMVLIGAASGVGESVSRVLNRVALVLVMLPLIVEGRTIWDVVRHRDAGVEAPGIEIAAGGAGERPDIYVIFLDEYGREDVLREIYGHDNRPFLDALRERGFAVADGSYSNYGYTNAVVSALLNFNYVQEILDPPYYVNRVMQTVANSAVFELLGRLGYRILTIPPGTSDFDQHLRQHRYEPRGGGGSLGRMLLTDYTELIVEMTPLRDLRELFRRRDVGESPEAQRVRRNLGALEEIAALPEPTLAYVHVMAPHRPFVFHADGSGRREAVKVPNREWSGGERAEFRRLYAEEVSGLNHLVLAAIDELLEASAEPPIIVLMGDHGPRPDGYMNLFEPYELKRKFEAGEINLDEWLGILMAVYLPGDEDAIYPTISPVNVFRVILSRRFGADLPLLEDRIFFTIPFQLRFEFTEIKDLAGEARRGEGTADGQD